MTLTCKSCGKKNRVPAKHLSDTGRCGACKAALPPADEPLNVDTAEFLALKKAVRRELGE